MKQLSTTIANRSFRLCLMTANMGALVRTFDDELISYFFQRCLNRPDEISQLSMYDLELLSKFIKVYPKNAEYRTKVGHQLLDELKDRADSVANQTFHVHFIKIIRNLIVRNIYDFELLDNLFRSDYIKLMYRKKKQLDGALYEIDGYTRINLKDIYFGNRLSDDDLDKFKHFGTYIPDQINKPKRSETYTYKIEEIVGKLFKHYKYAHAVGHHRAAGNYS